MVVYVTCCYRPGCGNFFVCIAEQPGSKCLAIVQSAAIFEIYSLKQSWKTVS